MKKVLTKSVGVVLVLLMIFSALAGCVNPEVNDGEQTGNENSGGENSGGENSGGENSGGENSGGENSGGESSGDENSGAENSDGENSDGEVNQGDASTDNSGSEGNENGEENGNTEHTHAYEWVTDVEPTYTAPGVKHKECACGDKTDENAVAERLIHSEKITDGAIDPSLYTYEMFNSFLELREFCSTNKEKLEGEFICLDLSSAKDDGIHVQAQYAPPPYALDYEEEKNGKYTNSKLITYYELYVKELGTDTDINEDVPYHSITLELVSTASELTDGKLDYEFFQYNDGKTMWNYVVKIYSDGSCIAEMYYYTGLDIDREWIASFLDEYIIMMD